MKKSVQGTGLFYISLDITSNSSSPLMVYVATSDHPAVVLITNSETREFVILSKLKTLFYH